jgi:hypothetical protein
MSSSYSKTDYFVQIEQDGKILLAEPGQIPAGTILNGRVMITVEGPGWDFAPKDPMTKVQFEHWIEGMKAKGYKISSTQW